MPVWFVILILIAFYWLMRETHWLTIRLSCGTVTTPLLMLAAPTMPLMLTSGARLMLTDGSITVSVNMGRLQEFINQIAKTELELEEVYYSGEIN